MSDLVAYDPDDRIPCDDDNCVGIVNAEGHCGTCGRVCAVPTTRGLMRARDQGDADRGGEDDDALGLDGGEDNESDGADDDVDQDSEAASSTDDDDGDADDDDDRRPCVDDMCTGILDRSGRCGVCGRVG